MVNIPMTMRCIRGDEWPLTEFKSLVNALDNPITADSITFHCPAGHKFTLTQAITKGIFTKDEANKILREAERLQKEYQARDWSVHLASDFLPNKEIVALNIPCKRCGKRAQWSIKNPSEDKIECRKFALCLQCCADWHNYNNEAFELLDKTHGRPYDLFWEAIFNRFLRKDLPPLDSRAAEELLQNCRKMARKSHSRHPQ